MSTFQYSPDHDVKMTRWSEQDIQDQDIRHDVSLEETAEFLCRTGTVEVVAEKAKERGLTFR